LEKHKPQYQMIVADQDRSKTYFAFVDIS